MQLVGYLDHFTFHAGDGIDCYVSSQAPQVTIDVVRLVHGDTNPAGPGFKVEPIPEIASRTVSACVQTTHPGSCMIAEDIWAEPPPSVTLETRVWTSTPAPGRLQGLVSIVDGHGRLAALAIGPDGTPILVSGSADTPETIAAAGAPLAPRVWYRLGAVLDGQRGTALLLQQALATRGRPTVPPTSGAGSFEGFPAHARCVVAALACDRVGRQWRPRASFNGKLELPTLVDGAVADTELGADAAPLAETDRPLIAAWRFEQATSTSRAVDISGRARHGTFVNVPARAMTGSAWAGDELAHTRAPQAYGAVHFHDDDLEDAGWSDPATIELPSALKSGWYAVRLEAEGAVDHIPFAVTPRPGTRRAAVTLLLPSFTYLAYANERMVHGTDWEAAGVTDRSVEPGYHDRALAEHPEFGLSLYDCHSDGSGVSYASLRRPLLNMRPDYRAWIHGAPRHLAADLYLTDWLEHLGVEFDVTTDHDVHRHGVDALAGTHVVITGCHPEYVSGRILDALDAHLAGGGSLMYLGGNGFYWVTSPAPGADHVIEVRRGQGGTRTWEGEPGEGYHSTTGEPGGLWRTRGRAPNQLVGVGFAGQGWDSHAPGYRRLPDSFSPEAAFAFDGIDADEIIGNFGLVMNGAAGDEIDRYDPDRGSPATALVLARSTGHSDYYQLCIEDVLMSSPNLGGTANDDVRSDIVLLRRADGGTVFSVGSISFAGSLSYNDYDNNVARLTTNVLNTLLHDRNRLSEDVRPTSHQISREIL